MSAHVLTVTLATVHGAGEAAEKLGVIAVALLAALVVLSGPAAERARSGPAAGGGPDGAVPGDAERPGGNGRAGLPRVSQRTRSLALLAALVLTPVLLTIDVWHTTQVEHLRAHPAEAAGAMVFGLVVVIALALLVHRDPRAFPILAVAALPFRLPISTGGSTSNLLIPLYLVVGAGALAYLAPRLRGAGSPDPYTVDRGPIDEEAPEGATSAADRPVGTPSGATPTGSRGWLARATAPRGLEWLLMASVVLYVLQATYSADFSKALENMVFFYVPFALLFALLREVRWTRELLLVCLGTAVALAVVFAGIGFVEYYRKHLFLNPKVVAANEYSNFFRVNSLFFDPNIYGRFLALVMVAVMAALLWSVRRRGGVR